MPETVLVTGGTGYVGGWCVVRLLAAGYRVRATVRSLDREPGLRAAIASQTDPEDRLQVVAAELGSDAGWDAAVEGCDHVLHVASPIAGGEPKDPDDMIRPAVEGTRRVLTAAAAAGVRRVVLTSSAAAATSAPVGEVTIDEEIWTDPERAGSSYRKSKVLAERAAWDFAADHPELELVTVLPGAILGPALPGGSLSSAQIIDRMVTGKAGALPRMELMVVDVRDLADLHLLAMSVPEAAGQRFLGVGEVLTMHAIADMLRAQLGVPARRPRTLPDVVVKIAGRFNPEVRTLVPMLGRRITTSSARAQRVLGWQPRPARETVVDTGRAILAARKNPH